MPPTDATSAAPISSTSAPGDLASPLPAADSRLRLLVPLAAAVFAAPVVLAAPSAPLAAGWCAGFVALVALGAVLPTNRSLGLELGRQALLAGVGFAVAVARGAAIPAWGLGVVAGGGGPT